MDEVILLIIAGAFALLWLFLRRNSFSAPQTLPASNTVLNSYEMVPSLFVKAPEKALFHAIRSQLPDEFIIVTKVRLEDIVRVKCAIKNPKLIWALRGRVKSRHVDFLIIDHQGIPYVAIELDGRSHDDNQATNADQLKNGIFLNAGLKLKRVRTGDNFDRFSARLSTYLTGLNSA